MSNGNFDFTGYVYPNLYVTSHNQSSYSHIEHVNYEVLTSLDPYIDYSQFDNWTKTADYLHSNVPDGLLDYVILVYRNFEDYLVDSLGHTGKAIVELPQTITTNDLNSNGQYVKINGYFSNGCGHWQRSAYNGLDYTTYVAAHEFGHHLFGAAHIDYCGNLCLMEGGVWNGSRGMIAWERERLGWIDYNVVNSDARIVLSDYMTTGDAYVVNSTGDKYVLLENRQKISSHDQAGDQGVYIYTLTDADQWMGRLNIDVQCADGTHNFSFDNNNLKITKGAPNRNSYFDEMNARFFYDSDGDGDIEKYICFYPVYHENAAWGDAYDAFDMTYNNVYSPCSNPQLNTSVYDPFSIEVVSESNGVYSLDVRFNNVYAGKPSKPQNLKVINYNRRPKIIWDANFESDVSGL